MKNKEIEELLKGMRDVSNTEGCSMNLDRYLVKLLLSYIKQLEKRNKQLYEGFMAAQEELTDYATKNEQLENKYDKALEILSDYNMPCEYVKPIIPDEYCEENCEVSDEVYKNCWNKHIELTLKGDSDD